VRRPSQQDDGQVSLAVVLLALVVIIAGVGLLVIGQASDARGKAQKAADAAALGAAEQVKESSIVDFARFQQPPTDPDEDGWHAYTLRLWNFGSGSGESAAHQYAAMNSSSTLNSYAQESGEGSTRISVTTLSEQTEEAGTADRLVGAPRGEADASAELHIKDGISGCQRRADWSEDSDDDDDDEDDEDSEPELESWEFRCTVPGVGQVTLNYSGDDAQNPQNPEVHLDDMFEIRLVQ